MITFLFLYIFLSGTEYETPLFSNLLTFSKGGFLGSNDPTPPAINIFGVINSFPREVVTNHVSSLLVIVSIRSFK